MKKQKQKQIRVLQILPELNVGGVEQGTLDTALYLKKQPNLIPFVASSGGKKVQDLEKNNIEHFNIPFNWKNPFAIIINTFILAFIVLFKKIDIIHARSRIPAWSGYIASVITKTKFITTFHGYYSGYTHPLKNKYNSVMTYGNPTIVSLDFMKNHVETYYNKKSENIKVIYRGIDLEKFKNISELRINNLKNKYKIDNSIKKIITLPGRLSEWKGQELLIKAAKYIDNKNYIYLLVGTGHYIKHIYKIIKKLKLNNIIVDENCNDIPALYQISDIIISASTKEETFGRVAVEAQASGKMIIASNIGGSCETIINNKTGLLFENDNYIDLAEKIKYAIDNQLDYKKHALENSKKFCINIYNKNINKIYCESFI